MGGEGELSLRSTPYMNMLYTEMTTWTTSCRGGSSPKCTILNAIIELQVKLCTTAESTEFFSQRPS